MKTYLTVW